MTRFIVAAAALFALTGTAFAVPISAFDRTRAREVYELSAAQAAAIGYASAGYIGFLELQQKDFDFEAGDTFNATSILNTVASGGANIVAILNGNDVDLTYTGVFLQSLGETVLNGDNKHRDAVAILFSGASDVAFYRDNGTTAFNASDSLGLFDNGNIPSLPSVPLPASLPALLIGCGGAWLVWRRGRTA